MKLVETLTLENDQDGNTWWSNNSSGTDEGDRFQLHVDRSVYVALGSPQKITVTVEPCR